MGLVTHGVNRVLYYLKQLEIQDYQIIIETVNQDMFMNVQVAVLLVAQNLGLEMAIVIMEMIVIQNAIIMMEEIAEPLAVVQDKFQIAETQTAVMHHGLMMVYAMMRIKIEAVI